MKLLREVTRGQIMRRLRGSLAAKYAAQRAGVDPTTWSHLENDDPKRGKQSETVWRRIAASFQVPHEVFLGSVQEGLGALLLTAVGDTHHDRFSSFLGEVGRVYGYTPEQWAHACGVDPGNLGRFLSAGVPWSMDLMAVLLRPTNKEPEALLPPADYDQAIEYARTHDISPAKLMEMLRTYLNCT